MKSEDKMSRTSTRVGLGLGAGALIAFFASFVIFFAGFDDAEILVPTVLALIGLLLVTGIILFVSSLLCKREKHAWLVAVVALIIGSVSTYNIQMKEVFYSDNHIGQFSTFSQDSAMLVFSSAITGNGDLYVMSTADGTTRQLTQGVGVDLFPLFSEDGKTVYFTRKSFSSGKLIAVNIDGTNEQQIIAGDVSLGRYSNVNAPLFSADQNQILYRVEDGYRLYTRDEDTSIALTEEEAWEYRRAFGDRQPERQDQSPDGQYTSVYVGNYGAASKRSDSHINLLDESQKQIATFPIRE
ncbi:MAG: hypothetical protein HOE53_04710 [Candidatus Magasanikbacteria bacterium]|jgi:hypothetical protein|nr:hypothetical protein [Candidatus Magasanikbacteria bacterium]